MFISRMLISNVHKSIIVMNSLDPRFSRNVFEAVQKTRASFHIVRYPWTRDLRQSTMSLQCGLFKEAKRSAFDNEPHRKQLQMTVLKLKS